ncbi:hypothetical protein Btru_039736 [Bulinus truncatus]|nr:hypothetical protein Btru_039736 [Bulinus truncatus]
MYKWVVAESEATLSCPWIQDDREHSWCLRDLSRSAYPGWPGVTAASRRSVDLMNCLLECWIPMWDVDFIKKKIKKRWHRTELEGNFQLTEEIINVLISSGRNFASRAQSPAPLLYSYYDTIYLGAAHGLSSILQMALQSKTYMDSHPKEMAWVKDAVDWLLSIQQSNGNFAPALDEVSTPRSDKDELVHWCHGAPGIVYLLARAYLVWREEKYLDACLRCGELTWRKGLLTKGPGICHGIAGSGYVFLLLYRLTHDKKHLYRAIQFANFILTEEFQTTARTPDSPYSLYEGLAGTVCFFIDLLQPEKAAFPFFHIYDDF